MDRQDFINNLSNANGTDPDDMVILSDEEILSAYGEDAISNNERVINEDALEHDDLVAEVEIKKREYAEAEEDYKANYDYYRQDDLKEDMFRAWKELEEARRRLEAFENRENIRR